MIVTNQCEKETANCPENTFCSYQSTSIYGFFCNCTAGYSASRAVEGKPNVEMCAKATAAPPDVTMTIVIVVVIVIVAIVMIAIIGALIGIIIVKGRRAAGTEANTNENPVKPVPAPSVLNPLLNMAGAVGNGKL